MPRQVRVLPKVTKTSRNSQSTAFLKHVEGIETGERWSLVDGHACEILGVVRRGPLKSHSSSELRGHVYDETDMTVKRHLLSAFDVRRPPAEAKSRPAAVKHAVFAARARFKANPLALGIVAPKPSNELRLAAETRADEKAAAERKAAADTQAAQDAAKRKAAADAQAAQDAAEAARKATSSRAKGAAKKQPLPVPPPPPPPAPAPEPAAPAPTWVHVPATTTTAEYWYHSESHEVRAHNPAAPPPPPMVTPFNQPTNSSRLASSNGASVAQAIAVLLKHGAQH